MKAGIKGFVAIRVLFLAYLAVLLWLLFGQRLEGGVPEISLAGDRSHINLVPFETIRLYVNLLRSDASKDLIRHATVNLAGNVLIFVPMGWFMPRIFRKYRWLIRFVFGAAGFICLVEIAQYVTGLGVCDVDDLILNMFGFVVGYLLYLLAKAIRKHRRKHNESV